MHRQRTVFRLTLVNGWNDSELDAYAELVRRGAPDLIEVKGVTYCGDSTASPLTIKHCPYHAEVPNPNPLPLHHQALPLPRRGARP